MEEQKQKRGRPRKNPGDPVTHYKKHGGDNLQSEIDINSTKYYVPYFPDKSLEVCEQYLDMYFEAMYERQMMWKRKVIDKIEKGPYTEDPVFLKFNTFANVYRELDDSAQWSINGIIRDSTLSAKDIVWKVLVYRMFNKPETFELTSFVWKNGIPGFDEYEHEKDRFNKFMYMLKALDAKPFTDAYTVTSSFAPGETWIGAFTKIAIPAIHESVDRIMDSMLISEKPTDIIEALKTLPGINTFMSNEIYQDLMYVNRFSDVSLFNFSEDDWVNVGPGSSLCLRAIFPNLDTKSAQRSGIYKLKGMAEAKLKEIGQRKGEPMPYPIWNKEKGEYEITEKCNITLCQIEDWLCEFSKYWRMYIRMYKMNSDEEGGKENSENSESEKTAEENTLKELM